MQLIVNGFAIDDGAATVTSMIRPVYAPGTMRHIRNRFIINAVCDLFGDGDNDLASKETKLRQALAQTGSSFTLKTSSGGDSPENLNNSLTGWRLTSGPDFLDPQQGDHVTLRRFRITAEAEYTVGNSTNAVIFYRETFSRIGNGGPLINFRFPINQSGGIPQTVTQSSRVIVTQTGQAIGHTDYPQVPDPVWQGNGISEPILVNPDENVVYGSPQRTGNFLHDFPISWTFVYMWDRNFMHIPTTPPL